ncbi:MAG TPA: bifunctional folylpolyglutamate synthase/dihydrofolate synthase [Hydrogenothermaceae bacterium]|nr:bifunctional folylpolyglutamate synthase/dihydrofolate synthase [Hydrogenothermaceae bacterium]
MKLFKLFNGKTFKIEPGLERIKKACEEIGNPQNKFPSILVAGTNGKGSTCAFLENIFRIHGFKTGLFTSPHIVEENERWQINRKNIENKKLEEYIKQIKYLIQKYELTYFEASTLLAFKYFADEKVDIAILEVGLGGRWDATNVATPEISVITNVSYDHMHMLGDTLEKIAFEKTGITRVDKPAVIGRNQEEILYWLKERKIKEYYVKDNDFFVEKTFLDMFNYKFKNYSLNNIKISLIGDYQIENASTAITSFIIYSEKNNISINKNLIKQALNKTFWPARLQKLNNNPITYLDGAHNKEAIEKSLKTIKKLYPDKEITVLFSGMKDKEIKENLEIIFNYTKDIIFTQIPVSRSIDENYIKEIFGNNFIFIKDIKEALLKAKEKSKKEKKILLIIGSLYLAGEVLKQFPP